MGEGRPEAVDGIDEDRDVRIKALYYTMRSLENKLGGGEGIEGLYGTLACSGMQKVLECMSTKCGMTRNSRLVDMGAGIGRPLLHAVVGGYATRAWGIEIDRVKCDKGNAFMRYAAAEMAKRNAAWGAIDVPAIRCAPIEDVKSLESWTHAYSFWEGVPVDSRQAFAKLFRASKTLQAIAVGQRAMRGKHPQEFMEELGFGPLDLVDSFSVSMAGSGRSFTAYIFNKRGFVPPAVRQLAASEEACLDALRPPTPIGAREALVDIVSSQESTELDTADALAWAADLRSQEACAPGVRTRIRSGALLLTAGRFSRCNDSAEKPAVSQVSSTRAGHDRLSKSSNSVHVTAAALISAEGRSSAASQQSASTQAVIAPAAAVAMIDSSRSAAAVQEPSTAKASGRGKSAVSTLPGAKGRVSRFGRLIRSGEVAPGAKKGTAPAPDVDDAPQTHLSSLDQETDAASEPAPASTEVVPRVSAAALASAVALAQARADAKAPVADSAQAAKCEQKRSAAEGPVEGITVAAECAVKDKEAAGPRGRKRPSPKKAPVPLGFRARRAPKTELFVKSDSLTASKTDMGAPMDKPRGLRQQSATKAS